MHSILAQQPGLHDLAPDLPRPNVLVDQVYGVIKHRILTCVLKPGERLVETELCAQLSVSRTPLREAFNRLVHEALIVTSPYKGYSVAPLTAQRFSDLCEVRRIIEPPVAALAAERATGEDVARLATLARHEYVAGEPESYQQYLRANSAFHLAIARSARNTQLESIVVAVLDRHQRPCYLGLDVGIDANASTTEHLEVVAAIRERNGPRAAELMRQHIAGGERRILAALAAAGY